MIHLDTTLLIRIAQADKRIIRVCQGWLEEEELAVSSVAWFEFICGPLGAEDVQQEGIAVCERVQIGLESGAYGAGRLSPKREAGVYHFQELVRAAWRAG